MSDAARSAGSWARLALCFGVVGFLAACRAGDREPAQAAATMENDVPVAINSDSPFQYPSAQYDQGIEGEVRLRLYVDSAGRVRPESTRVAASSGTPALDSAALRGAAGLQFAPAHRSGQAVGMAFYQPVIFRRAAERPASPAHGTVSPTRSTASPARSAVSPAQSAPSPARGAPSPARAAPAPAESTASPPPSTPAPPQGSPGP